MYKTDTNSLILKKKSEHFQFSANSDIFNNPQISDIVWDIENKIKEIKSFLKQDTYKNYSKRDIFLTNKIAVNEIGEESFSVDFISSKTKVFRNNSKYEMTMNFKSVEIEFINISVETKHNFKLQLPLCILPLFYFLDIENFKFFLTVSVKFNSDYTDAEFDFSQLKHFIKAKKDENEKDEDNHHLESQVELHELLKEVNDTKKEEDKKVLQRKLETIKEENNNILKKLKDEKETNQLIRLSSLKNIHKFDWYTSNFLFEVFIR